MYPPHHLGGYELACRDVVQRLRSHGHDVRILTTDRRSPEPVTEPDDPLCSRSLRWYWREAEILSPNPVERWRIERHNQHELDAALTEFQPDVVSAWHMAAMSLGLLTSVAERGVPIVFVLNDDWLVYGPKVDPWIRAFGNRPRLTGIGRAVSRVPTTVDLSGAPTAFCFVSDWVRDRARTLTAWPLDRSTSVYCGIDHADFPIAPRPPRRPWKWDLLYVGRVESRKGVHVAIEALAHLPREATLEIIGPAEEAYRAELETLLRDRELTSRVRFARSSRAELRDRYSSADALLFPVIWDEPFGLVPIEAMACGTPVIGTGTGGSAEFLLDDVNCLVTAPGDHRALADAVQKLAGDESLRQRLIASGYRTAEQLGVDQLADALEDWHVAAAGRFINGQPDDRPSLRDLLRSPGHRQT